MLTVYGIPNCDTIKKARRWLDAHQVRYHFHDYKKAGIDKATLQRWCRELGFEVLLNTRGTTWRKLPDSRKTGMNEARAVALMGEHTSLIKRPVVDTGKRLLAGFDESAWKTLL